MSDWRLWWPDLMERSSALELMDDLRIGGAELAGALRELRTINGFLGSGWLTLWAVDRQWRAAGRPARLSVLDVGAGSGDANRLLLAWADWREIGMRVTLLDIHPDTCRVAAAYYRDEPRVQVVCCDLLQLATQPADLVTAALFAHHFSAAQLPAMFAALAAAARRTVIVNDLERSWLAWAGIALATRVFSRNRMIRHDAPLSVRRGFRAADLDQLRAAPGLSALRYRRMPLFRYLIVLPGTAA